MQWACRCAIHYLTVCNTFFKKEDSKIITFQSGENRSMIVYLMVRKTDYCLVKDVKVISSPTASNCYLLYPLRTRKLSSLSPIEQ